MCCFVYLLLLLIGSDVLCQEVEVCTKTAINSCSDCIKSGAYCGWCKQLNFTKPGEQEAARCDTQAALKERGCMEEDIISPKNVFFNVKNSTLSKNTDTTDDPIQLQPQEVYLKLRPGLSKTFRINFQRIEGYPVDLYYLMDLSYSMEDDLRSIKSLGNQLFEALQGITKKGRIGFGSFVDKTVLPFTNTNPEKLKKPCAEKEQFCQPAFGYRHVLSMTADKATFQKEVNKQNISGNLDSPEGTLDAIMQAAVCGDRIGWRNSSTRIIVLTTDDGFHMAGDGKLAGILEPNDEKCYLENKIYSKSSEMDYPSVGQVATQLENNNIQPIFAVTKNMEGVYRKLSEMIPKSEVGVLSEDSRNVVELIKAAYNRLSSKVTVTHDSLPDNVKVTYTPKCPNGGGSGGDTGVCDNVGVGMMVSFDVTVTAKECLDRNISFTIGPLGIKDKLKVSVSTRCECECDDPQTDAHPYCNRQGKVNCGMCSCKDTFVGQKCECSIKGKDVSSLKAACQKDNGTECEGRGDCVCGVCQCHAIPGGLAYYGTHCECENESCEKYKNQLCGGNGKCICKNCVCDPEYEGPACQCKKSDEQCRSDQSVCNGRGTCQCNQCKCIEGYQRPFCKFCPACQTPCITKGKCIECLGFQTGPFSKNCSEACKSIHKFEMVDTLPPGKPCDVRDVENCRVFFTTFQLVGEDNYTAQILKKKECPELPNIYGIIGGSIAGVALIGLLILLLIKGIIYMNDLKEFRRFENEKKKAKWTDGANPLFQNATTTVANPTFTGE